MIRFRRRRPRPGLPEDPAVRPVEEILDLAAARSDGTPSSDSRGHLVVSHAIWLCACESWDDAPQWLIYSVGADGIGWQRLGVRQSATDVVAAEHLTGDHPPAELVLDWLRGEATPRFESECGPRDAAIFAEIQRRVLSGT